MFRCIGFRKLTAFNRALLVKHVWRIIQDTKSLMAKVLKSRYFKNSHIMKAEVGNNPYFIWRSLLWGRDLLAKRLCLKWA